MREDTHNPLDDPHGKVVTEEQATSATHVGLWKILAGSMVLVVLGFVVVFALSQ